MTPYGFCDWCERRYDACDCNEVATDDKEAGF